MDVASSAVCCTARHPFSDFPGDTFCSEAFLSLICSPASWKILSLRSTSAPFVFFCPPCLRTLAIFGRRSRLPNWVFLPAFRRRDLEDHVFLHEYDFLASFLLYGVMEKWTAIIDPFCTLSSHGSDGRVSCKCLRIHRIQCFVHHLRS